MASVASTTNLNILSASTARPSRATTVLETSSSPVFTVLVTVKPRPASPETLEL